VNRSTSRDTIRSCEKARFAGLLSVLVLLTLLFPLVRDASPESSESSPAALRAAILKSDYTHNHFEEKWRYADAIERWQSALSAKGILHELITDKQLEEGALQDFDVLVLPVAFCLSDEERNSILAFLDDAGGVVASAAVGTRDKDGTEIGWDFVEHLTSSRVAGYLGQREGIWVAFSGNTPLSIGIDPGFRLELYSWQQLAIVKATRDGYWSDWSILPQKITEDPYSDVAISHGTRSNGRVVWFGFNTTEVIDDPRNQDALRAFLGNAVRWAGRSPMSRIWYWPNNHLAAAVFTQDVEYLFHHAWCSANILKNEGIPGTWFCVSELALKNRKLVQAFAEGGEVASHSDDHRVFEGQPPDTQYNRLEKSITDLKSICPDVEVRGFRPPEERYDEATASAWAALGGDYIFGQPNFVQVAPETLTVEFDLPDNPAQRKTLVVIPRVVRDDHNALTAEALTDNTEILKRYITDLDRIYKLNGLYMFAYHSNLLCLPERSEVLEGMAKYAKTLDLWFATCGQVADWWARWVNVTTEIKWSSYRSLSLKAVNSNPEPVADISITVYLPGAPDGVEIQVDSPEAQSPDYFLEKSKLVVFADTLDPSSTQTYTITLQ
jgi:peptidoglycan/xylan/chitin deacetylase (PgdA/CDA1 family)